MSVCLSVKSHLTSKASVRPENTVTYSAGDKGQKLCGFFSETSPLQRSSTAKHTYGPPFSCRKHACALHSTQIFKVRARTAPRVLHFGAFFGKSVA